MNNQIYQILKDEKQYPNQQIKSLNKSQDLFITHVSSQKIQKQRVSSRYPEFVSKQLNRKKFDPDQLATTQKTQQNLYQNAEIHRKATALGECKNENEKCQCCGRMVVTNLLPLCSTISQLEFLGSGFPLFFLYFKYCIFILVILFLTGGAFNILSDIVDGDRCILEIQKQTQQSEVCKKNWMVIYSLINKNQLQKLNLLQEVLNLLSIFAIVASFQYIRYHHREEIYRIDQQEVTAGDYTVMLEKIPQNIEGFNYKEFITKQIQNKYSDQYRLNSLDIQPVKVENVNIAYDLTDLMTVKKEKAKFIQQEYQECLGPYLLTLQWPERLYRFQWLPCCCYRDVKETKEEMEEKIQQLENSIDWYDEKFYHSNTNETKVWFTGIAFVSFRTEENKKRMIQENNQNLFQKIFQLRNDSRYQDWGLIKRIKNIDDGLYIYDCDTKKEVRVKVSQAPEPKDIIWQNLGTSSIKNLYLKFCNFVVILLILAKCFAIIYYIDKVQTKAYLNIKAENPNIDIGKQLFIVLNQSYFLQKNLNFDLFQNFHHTKSNFLFNNHSQNHQLNTNQNQPEDQNIHTNNHNQINIDKQKIYELVYLYSPMAIGVIIVLMNSLIPYLLKMITKIQPHKTYTKETISLAKKNIFVSFCTTTLFSFLLKVARPWYYNSFLEMKTTIYLQNGLMIDQNYILIANAIVFPLIQLLDIPYLKKSFSRYLANRKKNYNQKSIQTMTQEQLNKVYENPEYDITFQYGYLINTMFLTAFYATLIPLSIIYSIIGITLMYWVEKYILLRRRTVEQSLNNKLSIQMIGILELFLPLYCFSNLLFDFILGQNDNSAEINKFNLNLIKMILLDCSWYAKLGFFIGVAYIFLPNHSLNILLFPMEEDENQCIVTWKNAFQKNFEYNNYDTENPATMEKTLEYCVPSPQADQSLKNANQFAENFQLEKKMSSYQQQNESQNEIVTVQSVKSDNNEQSNNIDQISQKKDLNINQNNEAPNINRRLQNEFDSKTEISPIQYKNSNNLSASMSAKNQSQPKTENINFSQKRNYNY